MKIPYKAYLSEPELIIAVSNKSRLGAEAIYNMYSRSLYFTIIQIVKNKEVAEDILQRVFLKIWNSFEQYTPERGRLFTWMVNIARNLAADELRSKRYHNSLRNQDMESAVNYIEKNYQINVNTDCYGIREFVHQLKFEQAEILTLVYFKGYTHAEAAKELKLPLGTVKTRVRYGLQALRSLYSKDGIRLKSA